MGAAREGEGGGSRPGRYLHDASYVPGLTPDLQTPGTGACAWTLGSLNLPPEDYSGSVVQDGW